MYLQTRLQLKNSTFWFTFIRCFVIISLSVDTKEMTVKYYLIFLKSGQVVDISSYDDEESRNVNALRYKMPLATQPFAMTTDFTYDEVQTLNTL